MLFCLIADLQKDLVKFYGQSKSMMSISPIRPDLQESLEHFYVQQVLKIITRGEKDSSKKNVETDRIAYEDVVKILKKCKNVYIQGNPGMGKSTFCNKLTLDWCKYVLERQACLEAQRKESDSVARVDFDFLFLLSLRETSEVCDVMQMIISTIICNLTYKPYDRTFLAQVLNIERCLVILDGLDEWSHPANKCKIASKHIPHRNMVGKCVYLTLTRPWKLNQIGLKDSEFNCLLEIDGVKNPQELISKVNNCLNQKGENKRNAKEFEVVTNHLSDLKSIPIIALQLFCIWYETEKIPGSQCLIYSEMIHMIIKRNGNDDKQETYNAATPLPKCFCSTKWSDRDIQLLMQLGKLAFENLFPENEESSNIVFTDDYLPRGLDEETKQYSLALGLLTEKKVRQLNKKLSHISFIHKTLQEFLAAFYMSVNVSHAEEMLSRVNVRGKDINDISQVFIFLCGLEPCLATYFSQTLMRITSQMVKASLRQNIADLTKFNETYFGFDTFATVIRTMKIMDHAYTECDKNGNDSVNLEMTHISFGSHHINLGYREPHQKSLDQKDKKMETVLCLQKQFFNNAFSILSECAKTIRTLWLPSIDESLDLRMCTHLQSLVIASGFMGCGNSNTHIKSPVLNLSECNIVENLVVHQRYVIVHINTDQLHSCRLKGTNLFTGNIAETLMNRNSCLRILCLEDCRSIEGSRDFVKDNIIYLTTCSSLEVIKIVRCDFAVSIDTAVLRQVFLEDYDLSEGNVVEQIKNSTTLTKLVLDTCKSTKKSSNRFHLDLTAVSTLQNFGFYACTEIDFSIDSTNLEECKITQYDLSRGNISEALSKASKLTLLRVMHCRFPETDERHINKIYVEIAPSTNVQEIDTTFSDVLVKFNGGIEDYWSNKQNDR